MNYHAASTRLGEYRRRIADLRKEMRDLQARIEPEPVEDYTFERADGGTVMLSELFGDKDRLFVVHNMGTGCPYCTLWADGFNGVYEHLQNRAAFAVASPDPPERQRRFAASRNWRFPMVSHRGTRFAADMGYHDGGYMPGVSVFAHFDGRLVRVSDTSFSPGDDFCTVWHLFDLLPEGPAGWSPRNRYAEGAAVALDKIA